MKLVLFATAASPGVATLGLLTPRGVVPVPEPAYIGAPQEVLEQFIAAFDDLRPRLESLAAEGSAVPIETLRLLPPVPRPGKILCTTAVYGRDRGAERQQLLMTLKSAESVIGPDDTIVLPDVPDTWQFVPQAALGLVIRGPARSVNAADWRTAVFGYTCVVDVMARGDQQFGRDFWLAKADTLGPLGPCIVTSDEIPEPSALRVRSWQNGTPAQDFAVADASHSIAEQVELATTIMTLHSGDVLACGTSADGPRVLADGDQVAVEVDRLGRLRLGVGRAARQVAAPIGSSR